MRRQVAPSSSGAAQVSWLTCSARDSIGASSAEAVRAEDSGVPLCGRHNEM
jgi:hypothetical protein